MTNPRTKALLEASLVTFLWSSSFVFIKIGLKEINPLSFATYRYCFASISLLAYVWYKGGKRSFRITKGDVLLFGILGFFGYFIAQGMQFFGLYYLEAITVTFLLNLTPIFVLAMGILLLDESPDSRQAVGILIAFIGVFVFFYGSELQFDERTGIIITLFSGIGWAAYMVISRRVLNRTSKEVVKFTAFTMTIGSVMLLIATILTNNVTSVSYKGWGIIVWLGIVNTAVAFLLWNRALRTLKAYEQAILQNSMLIQITILAVIFLNETLTIQKTLGISMVFIGVLAVIIDPSFIRKYLRKLC